MEAGGQGPRPGWPPECSPLAGAMGALARARSRLAGFQADPARHARHALRVLVKYHMMEEQLQPLEALCDWAAATPLLQALWERYGRQSGATVRNWAAGLIQEMVDGGVLQLGADGVVRELG